MESKKNIFKPSKVNYYMFNRSPALLIGDILESGAKILNYTEEMGFLHLGLNTPPANTDLKSMLHPLAFATRSAYENLRIR